MKNYYSLPLLCLTLLVGCADLNNPNSPYYNGGGYGYQQPYYGNGNSYDRDYYRQQRERERLDRERDRLEDERRRLEYDRNRQYNTPKPPVYIPPPRSQNPVVERCPSGFSPSENKCSAEERRRGCRDMRLPGGLGCVSR